MADPVDPWALEQARKLREQCFLTISLATKVGKDGDLKTACDLAEHAIYQALLSAVMRERESKWRPIEEASLEPFESVPSYWSFGAIVFSEQFGGNVGEAAYSYTSNGKGRWRWLTLGAIDPQPTHYQPLPAPPRTAETPDGK